ncbi:probable disease resistance RPP8-like protein 2 [Diospyros lotus]|uniref:probable disease resistance RPP8-like protein 2 n=1 Tax=Diospyros lotus TaxID=55363 RepID=UPI00224CEC49|nr:probable disease resistance RPP8-like protein 2 [Diospyros lotus]
MDAEWIVSLLMQKLQALLLDQATFTKSKFRNRVQRATNKLHLLEQRFRDAGNDQQMVRRLLGAIYFAEDAIDTFLTRVPSQRHGDSSEKFQPFTSLVYLWSQYLFTLKIQKFMAQIQVVDGYNNNISGLSLQNVTSHGQQQRRGIVSTSSYLDEEKDAVGLEDQVRELVGRLIPEHESSQAATEVISVVGEEGSGKTILARIVYERVRIKQHFKIRVWVNASNFEFRARDVMFEMLKQVDEIVAEAEEPPLEQDLMSMLSELLGADRYLIIVDDVGMLEVWERLRIVFPNSNNGSKIIVTTRNANVVARDSSPTVQTCRLKNEESWQLFLKKACIPEDSFSNNLELATFKEQILKLCGGLPMSIILIGGLLSLKESSHDERLSVIENASNLGGDIFTFSYQELPAAIKPCFLYMGLFPKAFEVPVRRLFLLWIAEGLVSHSSCSGELTPEDVANAYFEELINRNMIEVTKWRSDGIPKMCCMPGALYDVFSPKAADMGLFYVHCKSHYTSGDLPPFAVRRLASYLGINYYPCSDQYIQHLRSYVCLSKRKRGIPAVEIGKFLNKIIDLGLLTVLDLEGVYKPRLPNTLGKLFNLTYLGLRSTVLESLPDSVCDLPRLETLDVKHTMITTLPSSIWMRTNLRHLYMDWINFDDMPIPSASKLQTLWGLSISEYSPVLSTLNKITCLRKLGLSFSSTSQEPINNWIVQLTNLQSLRLRSVKKSGERGSIKLVTSTTSELTKHQKLLDLYLLGVLPRPVDVKRLPPNLKILTLSMSGLRKDPMRMLGRLPHLNILRLFAESYLGEEMTCHHGGFPHLHVLKLWNLMELKELSVEEGAMTCLREMEIRACRRLQRLDGLRHVTTLKELTLTNMALDFAKEVKESIGTNVFVRVNEWKPCPLLA